LLILLHSDSEGLPSDLPPGVPSAAASIKSACSIDMLLTGADCNLQSHIRVLYPAMAIQETLGSVLLYN